MERIFRSRLFHPASLLVLAAGIILAYSNTFHSGFQFDDQPAIIDNTEIQSLDNIWRVLRAPRGVTNATFALNFAFGGLDTFGYHIVNTAIHIFNSFGVYAFLYLTLKTVRGDEAWAKKTAVFSSLLFALHPVQTQAVTYIVQRMESLSSLFYIAGLLFFAVSSRAGSPRKRAALWAGTALSYALGFYSKESAITLPAVVFLYDFCFMGKGSLRDVMKRWPIHAALAAILLFFLATNVFTLSGLNQSSGGDAGLAQEIKKPVSGDREPTIEDFRVKDDPSAGFKVKGITPREYLYTQFNVLTYYISLLIAPVHQNLDYDFPVSKSLFSAPQVKKGTVLNIPVFAPAISLAVIIIILAAALYLLARTRSAPSPNGRIISFFILWYFILLSPTSSIVPIIDVIYEHRIYLASTGFFVIFVLFVDHISGLIFRDRAQKDVPRPPAPPA